ncbi:MAG: cytochrome oxidase [Rubrivivax sp.]|nr:MAG: cytochrome oxidase [Rubrivivax sp.]
MEILFLLVFVTLVLVGCSIGGFVFSVQQRDHEFSDRLALAPLADDAAPVARRAP